MTILTKTLLSLFLVIGLALGLVSLLIIFGGTKKEDGREAPLNSAENIKDNKNGAVDEREFTVRIESPSKMQRAMDIQMVEGIDEKMALSDLGAPPSGVKKDPFKKEMPFAHVPMSRFTPSQHRLLADHNTLTQPGIITFDNQTDSTREYYAYKYIFTNLKERSTQFVAYPYSFEYTLDPNDSNSKVTCERGGVFSLKPDLLPNDTKAYNYFKSFKAASDVNFGKAKALYDINVGVLKVEEYFGDIFKDLTYEGSAYCNLMSSYLGKYRDCMSGADYFAFKNDTKNLGQTAFVYLSGDDIANKSLLMTPDGAPRFQMFIVPDFYTETEDIINKQLGKKGIEQIKTYISNGGFVLASGKGGYLLETWGILPKKMYDTKRFLASKEPNLVESMVGCNNTAEQDFTKRLLCMNVTNQSPYSYSFVLSTYMIDPDKTTGMTVLTTYNKDSTTLFKKDVDGFTTALTTEEKALIPHTLLTTYNKGRILLMNGNPLFKSWYNTLLYNTMMLAMSRNIVFDSYIGSKENKPIPGGEAGIQLDIKLTFINLYDTAVKDVGLHIWFPNNVSVTNMPGSCLPDSTNMTGLVDMSKVNESSHIKCGNPDMGPFEKFEALINIEILDQAVTQARYDVLMANPYVTYTDVETGVSYQYETGGIRIDASLAALLRGTLNPDPVGFYPILGRGQYVDNVLQVENKEDTNALTPEFISIIPIISPLVDSADQITIIRLCRFLPSYYKNDLWTYYYPFTKTVGQNVDYLDYKWLSGKAVVLDAEWDIPVKQGKVQRTTAFPPVNANGQIDVENLNFSTTITSTSTVLKQIYYVDADRFFEHANARLMVFVDTSKPEGAAALYGANIPEKEKNPNKPGAARKEYAWTRSDIYFYATKEYLLPENINSSHVVSIDRYPVAPRACENTFGNARAVKEVPGYFTIAQPDGLKANEYNNELMMYCEKKKISLDEIEAFSNKSIKPIHYLVPIVDKEVKRADDLMDFIGSEDGTGYIEGYPEAKFIYAHYFHVMVPGNISRQGGRLEIRLPDGLSFKKESTEDPIEKGYVTYSADQVSFYKTTFDAATRTITGFFKRGLMPNEAYGKPSLLGIMIEQLDSKTNIQASLKIHEMKYDISAPEINYERFTQKDEKSITLIADRFFSLPAIEVHIKVNRRNCTDIFPYELLEPFTRIGVYFQELLKHRTIWGSAESHHVSEPGVQSINAAFAMISNVGISSVPFVEYLTVGPSLLIPSGPTTTRIEWSDIWGRKWSQPLRSTFPDIVPLPGPVRNFMMTTTFELTKPGTNQRVLEWNSDETLDMRVHVKLLNNYPKYFKITGCKDNEIAYFKENSNDEKTRIYDPPPYPYQLTPAATPNSTFYVGFGHRSVYGFCFDEEGTVLKGINVSATDRTRIATAYLCADTLDEVKMLECSNQLADLPTITKRPSTPTPPIWMYSPEVDRYYPKNYIKSDMWDMTQKDYDDSPIMKAMEYHMDNRLPGIDTPLIKPQNIIATPIFKGFGYYITYDSQKTLAKFPQYKGWWSDNLQNKDDTLLAGQTVSNDISVDKPTQLPASSWINIKDLNPAETKPIVSERLKNIHACLYNQNRVKTVAAQERYTFLPNVVQNNIIPIMPDLEKDDPRLTNFNCSGVYQYSPFNISQVDNIVRTPTIRDWFYFAANLRGMAKETINIPFTLAPYPGTKIEGMTKVHDGGRFVYWNPCCGPNTYLVVDNPVSVVESKRSDLTITVEVFPKTTTTFKPVLYHLLTIADPAEINREWKYSTYTNNYGFGDATVAIFVGGTQATTSVVRPGEYTMVKVTFYNNAGFDWNMYAKAIDFAYVGEQAISAMDLYTRTKHSIQSPQKYNFMIVDIPAEIKDYITIYPSDHNIDVAPQFFDLMNINVVTIRDGFKGDYYYRVNVSADFPEALKGKLYEIKLSMNESCFDHLPGYNDPTGSYHDYKLLIPSIKIGIPYGSGPKAGKVFYTSGYSKDLTITSSLPSYWVIQEARLITDPEIGSMRLAAGDPDNYQQKLADLWTTLSTTPIAITNTTSGTEKLLNINLTSNFPTFPLKDGTNPDIATFNVLVKCTTPQLAYGTVRVISSPKIFFTDFTGKRKSEIIAAPLDKTVASKGAWLQVSYTAEVVVLKNGVYVTASDQKVHKKDAQVVLKVLVKTKNVGTDTAYYANITLEVAQDVSVLVEQFAPGMDFTMSYAKDGGVLKLNPKTSFAAGDMNSEIIYVTFNAPVARRLLAASTPFTIIKRVSADIDLTAASGAVQVSQSISTPMTLSVVTNDRDSVSLFITSEFVDGKPRFNVRGTANPTKTTTGKNVRYLFYREILALDCDNDPSSLATGNCNDIVKSSVVAQTISESSSFQDKPVADSFTGFVRSGKFRYKVETYTELKVLLSSATWEGVTQRPIEQVNPNNPNPSPIGNENIMPGDPTNPVKPEVIANSGNSTEAESTGKDKGEYILPLWAIIVIPIGAFVVILIAGILIYRKYKLVKVHNETTSQEVPIPVPHSQPESPDAGKTNA